MASLELRPSFEIPLAWGADEAMQRIRRGLCDPPLAGRVASLGRVAEFRIPGEQQRLWSPHLSIQIEDADQGGLLHGRFSPRPEIWTGIMLVYVSVVFLIVCGLAYAYAQWVMERPLWALTSLPIGVGVIVAIHTASLIGQRLSADQIRELMSLLEIALERAQQAADPPDRSIPAVDTTGRDVAASGPSDPTR